MFVKDNDYFCNIMNIRSDIPQISALRSSVEERFGRSLSTHSDFVALVAVIENELHQHISESTLERVWNYSTRGYATVSLHTLNLLASYSEGCNWREFCKHLSDNSKCESALFDIESISTSDLEVGSRIRIGWLPDRVCVVRYMGNNRFIAEETLNATMQPGDSFSLLQFSLGKELTMVDFRRLGEENKMGRSYVVGMKNGITTLQLLEE